ncbi:unnamed protein product, partial [Brenthis ino]
MICPKCNDVVEDFVLCNKCGGQYHYVCAGVSELSYRKMGVEKKAGWRCITCRSPQLTETHPSLSDVLKEIKSFRNDFSTMKVEFTNIKSDIQCTMQHIKELSSKLDTMEGRFIEFDRRLTSSEQKLSTLSIVQKDLLSTQKTIAELKAQNNSHDQYSRQNNIEISGIPTKKGENVYTILNDLCATVGFQLSDHDIDSIHRVRPYPSSRTESNNEPTRPASIIVRFCQRRRKDQLIAAVRARAAASPPHTSDCPARRAPCTLNVRGLRTKSHSFLANVLQSDYDLIVLTETWLTPDYHDAEYFHTKYIVFRQDRKSTDGQGARGGGVLIAARRELRARPRPEWRSRPAAEELWVTLELDAATTAAVGAARPSRPAPRPCRAANASSNLHVACCYFPHGNNHSESLQNFYDNTFDILQNNLNDNFLILGDFNISNASWDSFNDSTQSFKLSTNSDGLAGDLCDFMNLSNFRQYNGCVNSNGRVLDLVLSSDKCTVSNSTTPLTPEDAHHKSLDITLNLQTHAFIQNVKTRLKLIYHAADFKAIGKEISRVNWIADLATLNTEESFIVFALCVAVASAATIPVDSKSAVITSQEFDNIGVNGYNYKYVSSDGKSASEEAVLKNPGTETEAIEVRGVFSYVGNDGVLYEVKYISNEKGFQPQGAHLPKA